MSEENTQNIETSLGNQLGSDHTDLVKGRVSIDRLGVLSESECLPIAWFKRAHKYLGREYCEDLFHDYQNLKVGVNGLGRAQVIQVIAASRGVNSTITVDKPPLLQRIFNPGWREKLESEGKQVRE